MHEHSPAVDEMADTLKLLWTKYMSSALSNPHYRIRSRYDGDFRKAALVVLRNDFSPDLFVRAQFNDRISAIRIKPNHMLGSKAIDRYNAVKNSGREDRKAFYLTQFKFVDRLIQNGFTPEEIVCGTFDVCPLITWVLFKTHGIPTDEVEESARDEYCANPEAAAIFGYDFLDDLTKG